MKMTKFRLMYIAMFFCAIAIFSTSCKSKKKMTAEEPKAIIPAPVEEKAPKPVAAAPVDSDSDGIPDKDDNCPNEKGSRANGGCPEVVKKAFNYKNIQFEFNSSVLKTSSYAALDEIATQMKDSGEQKFKLDGHSSAEGTEKRNMMLSVDRANAVKVYLVNNGISSGRLITEGFGESVPLTSNDTESGREINRRVEIKPQ